MAASLIDSENSGLYFALDKRKCRFDLQEDALTWKVSDKKTDKISSVKYSDIIGIQIAQSEPNAGKLTIALSHVHKKSEKWTRKKVLLASTSSADCNSFVTQVQEKLRSIGSRPKSLLVFINPDGGAKKGVKIFTDTVEPLFKLAAIETEVIVTKDGNHAGEVLATHDLSKVDGIVSVGGDGTFHQVIRGLMTRVARDQGKDVNDPEIDWSTPPQTVGIIPSGTGQGVVEILTGSKDITTAALHIVLGSSSNYNLFSVYNEGRLVSVAGLLTGYGLFGKMIEYTESHRSMGRARYPAAFLKTIFGTPDVFECEISYIPVADPKSSELGKKGSKDAPNLETTEVATDGWTTVRGRVIAVNMFVIPLPWWLHIQEPLMSLSWYHEGCTKMNMLKILARMVSTKTDYQPVQNITELPCKAFKMTRLGNGTHDILNIDGDPFPLTGSSIEVRLLPKVLKTYGNQFGVENIRQKIAEKSEKTKEG